VNEKGAGTEGLNAARGVLLSNIGIRQNRFFHEVRFSHFGDRPTHDGDTEVRVG